MHSRRDQPNVLEDQFLLQYAANSFVRRERNFHLVYPIAMAFDLTILIFTAAALMRNTNRSGLWQLLFRDGLVYWGITFSVNAIPAVSLTRSLIRFCVSHFPHFDK